MDVKIRMRPKIHNRFDVMKKNVLTGEEKQVAYAENIILDAYFNRDYIPQAVYNIQYGRGTGELLENRTTLFSKIAHATITGRSYTEDFDNNVVSQRCSIVLGIGTSNGETITEVGFGDAWSTLITHALLRDMNGNPIGVPKTNLDIITIYATLFGVFDIPWAADNGLYLDTCIPSDGAHGMLAGMVGSYYGGQSTPNSIEMIGTGINGLRAESAVVVSGSSVMSNKKLTTTAPRIDVNQFNYTEGIWSVKLMDSAGSSKIRGGYALCFVKNPLAPKHFVEGEQVGVGDGVTKDFTTKYPFVESGAVVKIDGIAASGEDVTIDELTIFKNADIQKAMSAVYNGKFSSNQYDYYKIGGDRWTGGLFSNFVFQNLIHEKVGLYSFRVRQMTRVYCSDDAISWTLIQETGATEQYNTITIPEAYRNKRFWRTQAINSTAHATLDTFVTEDVDESGNIHFTEAPAEGKVITINYETKVVPKDTNHVFDFASAVSFDRYTEE